MNAYAIFARQRAPASTCSTKPLRTAPPTPASPAPVERIARRVDSLRKASLATPTDDRARSSPSSKTTRTGAESPPQPRASSLPYTNDLRPSGGGLRVSGTGQAGRPACRRRAASSPLGSSPPVALAGPSRPGALGQRAEATLAVGRAASAASTAAARRSAIGRGGRSSPTSRTAASSPAVVEAARSRARTAGTSVGMSPPTTTTMSALRRRRGRSRRRRAGPRTARVVHDPDAGRERAPVPARPRRSLVGDRPDRRDRVVEQRPAVDRLGELVATEARRAAAGEDDRRDDPRRSSRADGGRRAARGPGRARPASAAGSPRRSRSSRMAMTYLRLVPVASRKAAGVSGRARGQRERPAVEIAIRRVA